MRTHYICRRCLKVVPMEEHPNSRSARCIPCYQQDARERKARFEARNPDSRPRYNRERREREVRLSDGTLPARAPQVRLLMLELFNPICMMCGVYDEGVEVDHVLSLRLEIPGSNSLRWLGLLCPSCNKRRGHKAQDDYRPAWVVRLLNERADEVQRTAQSA